MKYFSNKVLDKKIKEEGGGSGDYTAGEGIDISENEISIDSDTLDDIADGAEARGYFDANGILSTSRDPFWQIGETSGLVELKSAYSYVGAKKGIIFSVNQNEDANAHLEVVYKTMAGASNPIPVLHSKLPFYSDSFISAGGLSSGGGGGGGGATSLEGLDDVEYTGTPVAGQSLVYVIRDGVGLWTNATPTGGGTVTTVANVPPTSGGDIPKAELSAALGTGTVTQGNSQLVTGGSVYSAINSALSSVLKFVGVTTTEIADGSTTNPVIINGSSYTAVMGNVVLYGAKEYLWTGSAWEELGDEASWALKTITVTGTGYLTGGGSLEANRTIDISSAIKTKIEHGESAYNRTDWDQYLGIDGNGHIYVKDNRGFYSSSFVSAGGVGSGGGGGGGGATELADLEDINFVTPITGGQVLMYRDLGGGDGEWYNADIEVGGVKTVANVVPTSGGDIPLADLASAFTTHGYKLTDHEYTNGTGLSLSNGTFSLTQAVQTSLGKADTAIQTVYDLVIKNSAGTTQLTYKPATSGTYSITLTKAMVGLGDVENTKLSTWTGSGNITTVGTISNGTWQGTPIGYNYVAAHYIGGTRTASAAGQATLLGIDAISNAQSSGSSDLSRIVWDADNNAWHFLGNLYADGFVSAGGMSDSGGGGGASNLYDLLDMSSTISDKPSGTGQKIIVFNPNGTDKQNRSGAWEYANMPTGSVTSVAGVSPVNGDIPVASLQTAIGLGDYLPLSAGSSYPLTGDLYIKKTSDPTVNFFEGTTLRGAIYSNSTGTRMYHTGTGSPQISVHGGMDYPVFRYGATDYKIWHSGNLTKSALSTLLESDSGYYVKKSGDTMTGDLQLKNSSLKFLDSNGDVAGWLTWGGSDKQPKWYDTSGSTAAWETIYHSGNASISDSAITLGSTSLGTSTAPIGWSDAIIVHGITTEASITESGLRVYSGSGSNWAGSVASMGYAAILAIGGPSRGWQMWASRIGSGANALTWRNGLADMSGWVPERVIYDTGNLTKSVLTGLLDASGGYYLPLTGGTVSNSTYVPLTINSTATVVGIGLSLSAATKANIAFNNNSIGAYFQNIAVSGSPYVNIASDGQFKYKNNYIFLHSQNYSSYALPLSAGSSYPLTGALTINAPGNEPLVLNNEASGGNATFMRYKLAGSVVATIGYDTTGTFLKNNSVNGTPYVNIASDGVFKYKNTNPFYHSGNSNLTTVDWSAKSLTLAGAITGATSITASDEISCKTLAAGANDQVWTGTFTSTNNVVYLAHANANSGPLYIGSTGSSSSGYLFRVYYGQSTLGTGGTCGFAVRADGNVGIGTASPGAGLVVYTPSNPCISVKRKSSSGAANMMLLPDDQEVYGWLIGAQNNTNSRRLAFIYRDTTDTEMARLDTDGNFMCNGLYVSRTTDGAYAFSIKNIASTQGYAITGHGGNSYFEFHTNISGTTAKRASIASNGAFTTAASVTCSGIFVNQNASATATGIGLWGTSSPATYGIYMATTANYGVHGGVTSSGAYATYFQMNGTAGRGWVWRAASTNVASINTVGLFTTNGDQVISSDERLKTHIEPVKLTVEQIAGMRAVTYDRKDSGLHSLGVIAQDWEKVLPESVNQGEYLTFKYAQTAMVSAIILAKHETEQDKEIRKLKARVRDLEEQLKIRS